MPSCKQKATAAKIAALFEDSDDDEDFLSAAPVFSRRPAAPVMVSQSSDEASPATRAESLETTSLRKTEADEEEALQKRGTFCLAETGSDSELAL